MVVHGNYLLTFSGRKPEPAELQTLFDGMRQVDTTALPALTTYLPAAESGAEQRTLYHRA